MSSTSERFHLARHRAYSRIAAQRQWTPEAAAHFRKIAEQHLRQAQRLRQNRQETRP